MVEIKVGGQNEAPEFAGCHDVRVTEEEAMRRGWMSPMGFSHKLSM